MFGCTRPNHVQVPVWTDPDFHPRLDSADAHRLGNRECACEVGWGGPECAVPTCPRCVIYIFVSVCKIVALFWRPTYGPANWVLRPTLHAVHVTEQAPAQRLESAPVLRCEWSYHWQTTCENGLPPFLRSSFWLDIFPTEIPNVRAGRESIARILYVSTTAEVTANVLIQGTYMRGLSSSFPFCSCEKVRISTNGLRRNCKCDMDWSGSDCSLHCVHGKE